MELNSPSFPEDLVEKLRGANRIVALSGAGVSAESGVPTFRDAQTGLWSQYDPQELATPQAFQRNPRLVWEWYAWRRELVSKAEPNPGHFALAKMEQLSPHFTLITQNIDNLHQKAGSVNVVELHGNLGRTKCYEENQLVEQWADTGEVPPRCPVCGGLLRPDVVWFGENLPPEAWRIAIDASREADLFFTIGTSGIVQPAASLPLEAIEAGATVVEINPTATPISPWMDYTIRAPSGIALPALIAAAWPNEG